MEEKTRTIGTVVCDLQDGTHLTTGRGTGKYAYVIGQGMETGRRTTSKIDNRETHVRRRVLSSKAVAFSQAK
jgi:hypothetical protein